MAQKKPMEFDDFDSKSLPQHRDTLKKSLRSDQWAFSFLWISPLERLTLTLSDPSDYTSAYRVTKPGLH